jgi:LuxR family quorum-sensing system transcriptional regulator SolR
MALQNVPNPAACQQPGLDQGLQLALQLCSKAKDLLQGLATLASTLRFDGLSYLVLNECSSASSVSFHLSTAGPDWPARYAKRHYQAIDPRITGTRGRHVPIIWDATRDETDWRVRNFLDHAGRFRIRSGVAISLRDARVGRVVIAWDSAINAVDEERKSALEHSLGTLTLLAGSLHEAMLVHCLSTLGRIPPSTLTDRERDCLMLAAHGMTSSDIGVKLGITGRTVNFHFGNIISKLGVLNRSEAVARAVAHNIVSLSH